MKRVAPARKRGTSRSLALTVAVAALAFACEPPDDAAPERTDSSVAAVEPAKRWPSIDLTTARRFHAAEALGDGSAVVCGGTHLVGFGTFEDLRSCERLVPDVLEWEPFPELPNARRHLTLTALAKTGSLVVAGGSLGADAYSTAYTGSRAGWAATPESIVGRINHTSTLLRDGTILLVGGTDPGAGTLIDQAQLRDTNGEWKPAGVLARMGHAAALLHAPAPDDENVLASGGFEDASGSMPTSRATIYSRKSNEWMDVEPMSHARSAHTLTSLDDGSVLAIGGQDGHNDPVVASERYSGGRWREVKGPRMPRFGHAAAKLGRYVVVAGGNVSSKEVSDSVEVYDPITDTWADLWSLQVPRNLLTLTPLGTRRLVAAAGADIANEFATAEVLAPSSLGAGCSANQECVSGHCVDGVCCDTECGGVCNSCKQPAGECRPVTGLPEQARGACEGGLLCASGACLASCSSEDDCVTGRYCDNGACLLRKAQGADCAAGKNECQPELHCTDGVCCDSACTGQCESCNGNGICVVAPRGPAPPDRASCRPGRIEECAAECDGTARDDCKYPGGERSCGTTDVSCQGGFQSFSDRGTCDFAGNCATGPAIPISCPDHFSCEGKQCRSSCERAEDCQDGFHCEGVQGCIRDCHSNDDCSAPDLICSAGRCLNGCTPDRRAQLDGQECGEYVCNWRDGRCFTQCTSNWDCAPGNYCSDRVCKESPLFDGELTGCAFSPRPSPERHWIFLSALGGAFGWGASRRRRRGNTPNTRE